MRAPLSSIVLLSAVACGGGVASKHDAHEAAVAHREDMAQGHDEHDRAPSSTAAYEATWTCSMHPEVVQDHPGSCPKCGMNLVEVQVEPEHGVQGGSAHMAHMAQVRQTLQGKLGADYEVAPAGLDQASPDNGQAIFDKQCSTCHGAAGKGDGPAAAALDPKPADFTDSAHARFYTDAGRLEIIRNGIPLSGTAMVGFKGRLSSAEILDVYAYVASLRGEGAASGHDEHHHHDR